MISAVQQSNVSRKMRKTV